MSLVWAALNAAHSHLYPPPFLQNSVHFAEFGNQFDPNLRHYSLICY